MNSTSSIRPWQFFLTASFLGAAALVWIAPPAPPVALMFMSLGVFAAGACAAALHGVLTALSGKSAPAGAPTGSAREALEREKRLTLRALKDLEFDKAMRKVSEADAAPMERRLRERAIAIISELDGREALRARVEADVAARRATGHRPQATGLEPVVRGPGPLTCAVCATANDPDARFCKACGGKL